MRETFPFHNHLTIHESDIVERWRNAYADHIITAVTNAALFRLNGRTQQELRWYIHRNPRASRNAA